VPALARNLIKLRTSGGTSPSSGGSTGNFGYHVLVPTGGSPPPSTATIDISDGMSPPGQRFIFRLNLNSVEVFVDKPIWTGGTIAAGLKIWLIVYQDGSGQRARPTFASGSGGFASNIALQQIDGTANTRTMYPLTFEGTYWTLDVETVPTGMLAA